MNFDTALQIAQALTAALAPGIAIGIGIGIPMQNSAATSGGAVTNYLLADDATILIDGSGNRLTNA